MAKAEAVPVFDGHNDTLLHLAIKSPGSEETFFSGREEGHIDFPKARAGGLAGGLFAMFTPTPRWKKEILWREVGPDGPRPAGGWDVPLARRVGQQAALSAVMTMLATLYRLERMSNGRLRVVRSHRRLTWPP